MAPISIPTQKCFFLSGANFIILNPYLYAKDHKLQIRNTKNLR